jgi:hypothetical protein
MTLEQKNEMTLYKMTIENRLQSGDEYHDVRSAILDLESILIKTQYLVNKFKTGGLNHGE